MKKLSLLILVLSIGFLSYSQDTVNITPHKEYEAQSVYDIKGDIGLKDTSALTAREVYQDAKEGFRELINSLQGPSKHIYEVYITTYFYDGIAFLTITILFWIFSLIVFFKIRKKVKWDGDSPAEDSIFVISIIMILVSIGLTVTFFCGNSLIEIVNPEYFAIEKIASLLHLK